jgi:hypothetical protein
METNSAFSRSSSQLSGHRTEALGEPPELVTAVATDGERTTEVPYGDGPHACVELLLRRADGSGQPDADAKRDEDGDSKRTEGENPGLLGTQGKVIDPLGGPVFHGRARSRQNAVDGQRAAGDITRSMMESRRAVRLAREGESAWRLFEQPRGRRRVVRRSPAQ